MKTDIPKVSIIVPVYNRQDQVYYCLKSISLQEYSNFEVIIIDDGSIDATSHTCLSFVEIDNRFKYYYQENKGVSAARNKGIKEASGEWITFVDSDDAITSNHLSVLEEIEYNKNECNLIMTSHGGGMFTGTKFIPYSSLNMGQIVHKTGNRNIVNFLFGEYDPLKNPVYPIWNKFFQKSTIKNNNLLFHEDLSLGEDQVFVMEYLIHIHNLFWIDRVSYLSLHWVGISHLGSILRSPENFWYNQLANFNALMSVARSADSNLAKEYAFNYLFDRPITRILYRFTKLQNIRLYPKNKIISFFRNSVRPIFISHKNSVCNIHEKWVYRMANLIIKDKVNIAYYASCILNILWDLKQMRSRLYYSLRLLIKSIISKN